MIDLHCHVLPGIDDGPQTLDGAVALARVAEAAGTRTIVATPHVSSRYPNDAATIARRVEELNTRLAAEGLALEIVPGAEIALTRVVDIAQEELADLALGGGGWLLVEPPFTAVGVGLDTILLSLQRQGRQIVLAHPERCSAFRRDPRMLEVLVANGVLTSITAGSLVGQFGEDARRFALELVREEMVHNVASDAHDQLQRPPSIANELRTAGLLPLADWLTEDVPAALLAGEEAPARPRVSLTIPGDFSGARRRRSH